MREAWQNVVITGGASGIGLRLAELLAADGVTPILIDRAYSGDTASRLDAIAPPAHRFTADVTDVASLEKTAADIIAAFGPPDLVVNSAGIQIAKAFDDLGADEFERVVAVNLIGSRNVAAAFLPRMQAGSQFVLVASLAGLTSCYGYTAYNASKFGVVGLAGALRLEYKPKSIGIAVVCPPEVETPLVAGERTTAPLATTKLKSFAGTLTVDRAASEILAGMRQGKWLIVPGRRARLTMFLARKVPGLMNAISDGIVSKAIARERKGLI